MRTNIDIDDALMADAMKAGPYKTKKDAVEAGLKLLARQAAYREVLKWRGQLEWQGDEAVDWAAPAPARTGFVAAEPAPRRNVPQGKAGRPRARR
jgi:antitoxin ParD1/3/4